MNTGSLSYEDMHGSKKENSLSLGLTGSWKQDSGKAKDAQANTQAGASSSLLQNLVDTQKELNKQWGNFKKETIFAPGAFAIKDSEKEQTARATVGQGTIIVRNDPNADISGLNRDTGKALTEETIKNTNFKLDPLFSYVDKAFGYTGIVLKPIDIFNKPGSLSGNEGDGNKPTNSIIKDIQGELGRFYKDIKTAWGIKD